MLHNNRRRAPRSQREISRRSGSAARMARFAGNGVFVLLGLAVLGVIAALSLAVAHQPTSTATGRSAPDGAAASTQAALAGQAVWIPLHSTAPADILAAARHSTLLAQQRTDGSDHVTDVSRLGTPVLVQPLWPETLNHVPLADFYIVPILNAHGDATDAAELELNASHTAIHVVAIVTYATAHPQGAVAVKSAQAALATVSARARVPLRASAQPRLVYFPLDAQAQQTGQLVWNSGGEFPGDPVWLVPGADGHDRIVGNDGALYLSTQIPRS